MPITPLMPVYPRCDVRPVKGEGCWLIGEDGRRYLDFASGIAVNLLGHSHAPFVRAIQNQAATLMHVSNLYGSPQGEALARRLVDNTFADTVFFTNSGAEAVECAIKTARKFQHANGHPERTVLICFSAAFHGRTMATISATQSEKMTDGFAPLLSGYAFAPFDDLEAARALVDEHTAGFLVEPIQGEGGIRPASRAFLQGLRDLADEHGLMLIFDEVQCGMARTGTLYVHEQYGVRPDIMASAKGIGGGFPLGACLATERAASGMGLGTHGSTYGGNPLAMAAGMAVLDAVLEPGFLEHVRAMGDRLRTTLEQFIGNHADLFDHVRGTGLMLGLRLKQESRPFVAHLRDNHQLLTVAAADNVVRILPPLIIEQVEIDAAMEKLSAGAESWTRESVAA